MGRRSKRPPKKKKKRKLEAETPDAKRPRLEGAAVGAAVDGGGKVEYVKGAKEDAPLIETKAERRAREREEERAREAALESQRASQNRATTATVKVSNREKEAELERLREKSRALGAPFDHDMAESMDRRSPSPFSALHNSLLNDASAYRSALAKSDPAAKYRSYVDLDDPTSASRKPAWEMRLRKSETVDPNRVLYDVASGYYYDNLTGFNFHPDTCLYYNFAVEPYQSYHYVPSMDCYVLVENDDGSGRNKQGAGGKIATGTTSTTTATGAAPTKKKKRNRNRKGAKNKWFAKRRSGKGGKSGGGGGGGGGGKSSKSGNSGGGGGGGGSNKGSAKARKRGKKGKGEAEDDTPLTGTVPLHALPLEAIVEMRADERKRQEELAADVALITTTTTTTTASASSGSGGVGGGDSGGVVGVEGGEEGEIESGEMSEGEIAEDPVVPPPTTTTTTTLTVAAQPEKVFIGPAFPGDKHADGETATTTTTAAPVTATVAPAAEPAPAVAVPETKTPTTNVVFDEAAGVYHDPTTGLTYDIATGVYIDNTGPEPIRYHFNPSTTAYMKIIGWEAPLYFSAADVAVPGGPAAPVAKPVSMPTVVLFEAVEAHTKPQTFLVGAVRGAENTFSATVVVGRQPGCDVVLSAPDVSPVHAEIRWDGAYFDNAYYLVDVGSFSGTFHNGGRLSQPNYSSGPVEHPLSLDDVVCFGKGAAYRVRKHAADTSDNSGVGGGSGRRERDSWLATDLGREGGRRSRDPVSRSNTRSSHARSHHPPPPQQQQRNAPPSLSVGGRSRSYSAQVHGGTGGGGGGGGGSEFERGSGARISSGFVPNPNHPAFRAHQPPPPSASSSFMGPQQPAPPQQYNSLPIRGRVPPAPQRGGGLAPAAQGMNTRPRGYGGRGRGRGYGGQFGGRY